MKQKKLIEPTTNTITKQKWKPHYMVRMETEYKRAGKDTHVSLSATASVCHSLFMSVGSATLRVSTFSYEHTVRILPYKFKAQYSYKYIGWI